MRRDTRTLVRAAFATVLGVLSVPLAGSTEGRAQIPPPPYNPYPSGILPANIDSERERIRREIEVIFGRYFAEWQALTPTPTNMGNPPILAPNGYEAQRILGGLLNFDMNISPFRDIACSSCHMPYAAFSGPIPSVNLTMVAYPGSFPYRAGKRTAQRYTYSHTFPVLNFDTTQQLFFGGNFWDGRATGMKLQAPDAEQAQGPPVDPAEHMFPDTACIALRLSQAVYRPLFELVWGADFDINFPSNTEQVCATPNGAFGSNTTPVALSPTDRTKANNIYDHWGQSLSFLERSIDISPFNSKFDFFLAGGAKGGVEGAPVVTLTADEMAGFQLFNGKGNCNSCHVDGRSTTLTPGQTDTGTFPPRARPLFTDFGYSNLGLPLNPRDAIYYQTTPDPFGFTANPFGFAFRDLGLGTFLRSGPGSAPNPNSTWTQFAPRMDGQMQVSSVRNVAMTPPQCPTTEAPGPYFQKEFFHNGYIKSLKQLVHFYNTRDLFAFNVTSGNCPAGTTEKVDCWPMPEVENNIDMTVGNLGLTDQEENLVVIAMQTLTDGFNPANPNVSSYPNINTFTGQCMTGGSASTQGNEFLIPTPSLPPCAPEICGVAPVPNPPIP